MTPSNSQSRDGRYCYRYPHPALTTDCVVFGFDGRGLQLLLIERGIEPFKGMWALPGGFVNPDETVEQAAARELREETGLEHIYLEQFRVYSDPGRDPRERVVTVAFISLVRPEQFHPVGGDDAAMALWFDEDALPPLAFDHERIISEARRHLAEVLRVRPIAFELLSKHFSMSELQRVYEAINRTTYDRRNFQRKVMQTGMIEELDAPACEPEVSMKNCRAPRGREVSEPCQAAPAPESQAKPGPRARKKLFSFRKKKGPDDDDSTRGLFNF